MVEDEIAMYDNMDAIEILRVKNANEKVTKNAVAFVKSQLGKRYDVNWYHKNADSNSKRWNCVGLVWVAYWNASLKDSGRPISIAEDLGWYDKERREWRYDRHAAISPRDAHFSKNTEFVSG